MRFDDLRIVFTHGGGTNHHVRVAYVLAIVTFSKFNSHLLQTIGRGRFFRVGTGDTETQIDQHLGDARHADATNADKMDVLNSAEHNF